MVVTVCVELSWCSVVRRLQAIHPAIASGQTGQPAVHPDSAEADQYEQSA
tara:strand:- start:166 stop:315 length:150 start_codon:yes stop_codon:yes gene_type:complete